MSRRISLVLIMLSIGTAVWSVEPDSRPEDGRYSWTIELAFPRFNREDVDGIVRDWLLRHIPQPEPDVAAFHDFPMAEASWKMEIESTVHHPSDTVASVEFTVYRYPSGAAHPSGEVGVVNINLESGTVMKLEDIFSDPDKALEIFAAHAAGLIAAERLQERPDQYPDGFDRSMIFADGLEPNRENYASLILEPEGVRVVFQQYQALPYAYGMPRPLFPLELLRPAGPSREVWPRFWP